MKSKEGCEGGFGGRVEEDVGGSSRGHRGMESRV